MSDTKKTKVGRKKGQKASKDKYLIEYYDKVNEQWEELGIYPSLKDASEKLNLSYAMLSDLNIGRRKIYDKFYRVTEIKKITTKSHIEEEPDELIDMSIFNKDMLMLQSDSEDE